MVKKNVSEAKEDKRAAALRANLRRRKEKTRNATDVIPAKAGIRKDKKTPDPCFHRDDIKGKKQKEVTRK